ncbi:hypothetical protein [Mitsuaria sp. 7]|uniref:hypothetical protein n=1 Tax=Mitsuaria sp. 7 TaxID=1658665 RepID=UPI0007DD9A3E|nr:hypothetical protein [Mitsuaria sp. 7]ANH66646.1 hypothetical protein ABE85_02045 [Mitsuaria sp. 7]
MAVWQFDVQLFQVSLDVPLPSGTRGEAWRLLPARFGANVALVDGWIAFGDEAGNRVDLVELEHDECELHARFDARSSDLEDFVARVCELAIQLGCQFYCDELSETIAPVPAALKHALQRSVAWRYALDPGSFLSGL